MQGFVNFALKVAGAMILINIVAGFLGITGLLQNPLGALQLGNRS